MRDVVGPIQEEIAVDRQRESAMQFSKHLAIGVIAAAMSWIPTGPLYAQPGHPASSPQKKPPPTRPTVRDHGTGTATNVQVRDHRTGTDTKANIRDHRTGKATVRDHRTGTDTKVTVRDHRGSEDAAGGVKVTDSGRKRHRSSGKECVKSILGGPCIGGAAVAAAKAGKVIYDKSLAGEVVEGTRKGLSKGANIAKRGAKAVTGPLGN